MLIGCNLNEVDFKDLKPPLLDGTFAIPVGFVNYSMRELMDSIGDAGLDLSEDSTSLLFLTYRDTAQFTSGTNIIEIEDVTNTGSIPLVSFTNPGPNVVAEKYDSTFTFRYPANKSEEVDSIFYQSGSLVIDISKTFPYDLIYDVSIQNTRTKDGNAPINIRGTVPSANSSANVQRDLSDYKTILSFEDNQNTFEFKVSLDIVLAPGESISDTDFVTFNLSYINQNFEIIYGKFGQDTTAIGNQIIDVGFFSELGETGLEFGGPVITFDFNNSYGVPLGVLFGGMFGVEGDSIAGQTDTTYLTGAITTRPQVIEAAQTVGETRTSSIVVDRNNSSLQDLLSSSPNQIGFDLSAVTNPLDTTVSNFLMDGNEVETYIEIYMPLEIALNNLTRSFEFDLGDGLDFNEVDSLSLRLVTQNGLPFSAFLEFEIVNDSLGSSYQIPTTLVLESAFIDSRGLVNEKRKTVSDISVGKDGVEAFKNGGNLFLRFILNTPANTSRNSFIKVLGDYTIDIQLSMVGKVNYQP